MVSTYPSGACPTDGHRTPEGAGAGQGRGGAHTERLPKVTRDEQENHRKTVGKA